MAPNASNSRPWWSSSTPRPCLHDDVVDESSLRRGRATANAMFGNAASVLVGDFLYSRAFQMMVSVNRMRVLEVLADATNVIAEGEVLQLMNMHDPDLSVDDYLQVIRYKTAKLFEASARLGAVLAGADESVESRLRRLRAGAGHGLPVGGRPARLRRQHRSAGQERGRRPARRQAHLALLVAMERGTAERDLIRHAIEQARCRSCPRSWPSCGALARWTRRARPRRQRG
jgi:octaprenyl-diphosphate synthase